MLTITAIPAFNDNYIWLIERERKAWVIDPGDPDVVMEALAEKSLQLEGLLITHHHRDHTGGINSLLAAYPDIQIYGPKSEKIPQIKTTVCRKDTVAIFGFLFHVLEIPGHTLDHIAFYCADMCGRPVLFCGDTLFSGGCGRVFEGTYSQMYDSLMRLNALPDNTEVYCTHEYTLANLSFATEIEPDNFTLSNAIQRVKMLRANSSITLPTTLAVEREINPFLRCDQASVIAQFASNDSGIDPVDVFANLRKMKDNF